MQPHTIISPSPLAARDLGGLWLIRVRWAAFVGQIALFALARSGLGLRLDWSPLIICASLLLLSNILLASSKLTAWRERRTIQGAVLLFDVLLLTALLFSYGGYTNPFGMVYLVHVVLAALLLGGWWTWAVSGFSALCYLLLFYYFIPVAELASSHGGHGASAGHGLHLWGMFVAFTLIATLISGFLQRMRTEIDWREQELLRRKANEEKLVAVTTLSASVAHELGTPLGSMMLMIDGLRERLGAESSDSATSRDLAALEEQLERCVQALQRVNHSSGQIFGESPRTFTIAELLTALHARQSPFDIAVQWDHRELDYTLCLPFEGLRHVLEALLRNAEDACHERGTVRLAGRVSGTTAHFEIHDTGSGMTDEQVRMVGEPFFSTKDFGRGMGLGLFIARLFAERFGGSLRVASTLGEGTSVFLSLSTSHSWEATT